MRRFRAVLRGSEEVPPVRTNASGTANFVLSRNGRRLSYVLRVNNIRRFTQAHIHLGARGVNGPVVAFLFGLTTPGISVDRGVVRGTIRANDLVGPLQGRTLAVLVQQMRRGNTYVNAHTEQNPDGEIRGQIRRRRRRRC
ncbi:CHRD domain-containing protein [Marinithermofilum abyssi]|uniref:CHRD domain-containing protein n=1 Tax=Marinithermofilum abyssi TaxID=1571185 RepID=A0A8J2YFI0_9BACL|nr:CHRD domain-containing protein [Marinithermofilum abyssi]GGE29119.1 CHRD domain-containing protein [Marinithermofilum abyssi]